ncbi:MAG: hypothetical protein M1827_004874 [Pycnora praestabilis]|nr:MAG: hypothetical protein M1827_004874 [Pycnora praestabilis]
MAVQTAVETGAHTTLYPSYSGLTQNSAITQIIQGTPTVVPLWYCGPSQTAEACKACPSSAASGTPACTSGYNAIVVYPVGAIIVGGIVPPPAGLPTLTIGPDGGPTELSRDPTSNPTSSQSSELISVVPSCNAPSLKAADLATPAPPSPTAPPIPQGTPASTPASVGPLPVLSISNANPAQPTAFMSCGPGVGNPYYNSGFYQSGDSFSRDDGLNAIDQFCNQQVQKQMVVGQAGIHPQDDSSLTAIPLIVQIYSVPGGSGKIMVRMQADVNNANGVGDRCPGNTVYSFAASDQTSVLTQCKQFLGQTIDYCDNSNTKSSQDTSWKHGGTFFTNCFYFTVILSPSGGDSQVVPS